MHTSPEHIKSWHPDRPVSKGASAFHDAVVKSSWVKDILFELSKIINPRIKNGDIIVDFGAGTGTSAIYLLSNLKKKFCLWLVDNSPSWLAKAYELLSNVPDIEYFILEKKEGRYATLAETVGEGVVDHVISANTIHLIPDIEDVFKGVSLAIKKGGTFVFQTGNFLRKGRPDGALMIDDTVQTVHDLALEMVRNSPKFKPYIQGLDDRIKVEEPQRKFVFPEPRPIEFYLKAINDAGLEYEEPLYISVKIRYSDWLNFLRVKRLQAGILPEIGGKEPTPQEENDRDELITQAALKLFADLKKSNPLANEEWFTIECVYVLTKKV